MATWGHEEKRRREKTLGDCLKLAFAQRLPKFAPQRSIQLLTGQKGGGKGAVWSCLPHTIQKLEPPPRDWGILLGMGPELMEKCHNTWKERHALSGEDCLGKVESRVRARCSQADLKSIVVALGLLLISIMGDIELLAGQLCFIMNSQHNHQNNRQKNPGHLFSLLGYLMTGICSEPVRVRGQEEGSRFLSMSKVNNQVTAVVSFPLHKTQHLWPPGRTWETACCLSIHEFNVN